MGKLSGLLVFAIAVQGIFAQYPLNTGGFFADEAGNSFTRVHDLTDAARHLAEAGLSARLIDSGHLSGGVDTEGPSGLMSHSMYNGRMMGRGRLFTDTLSRSRGGLGGALSNMRGFMMHTGRMSGRLGAGNYHLGGKPLGYPITYPVLYPMYPPPFYG